MPLANDRTISVGDIVMISGYGNDKFLVCRGWYTYEGSRRNGWYFKRIPDNVIVPDFTVDIDDVTVISGDHCGCPPKPGHKPPLNPENVNAAFVTVDTIEERNSLCFPLPPDGKIVRVNDVKGEVKYYIWNAESFRWDDFEFEPSTKVVNKLRDLDIRISNVESNESWKYIADMLGVTT